jgi:hypothetical protein
MEEQKVTSTVVLYVRVTGANVTPFGNLSVMVKCRSTVICAVNGAINTDLFESVNRI